MSKRKIELILWCTKCGKETHYDDKEMFQNKLEEKEEYGWYYCLDCLNNISNNKGSRELEEDDNPFVEETHEEETEEDEDC